jgi:hypothetical protein
MVDKIFLLRNIVKVSLLLQIVFRDLLWDNGLVISKVEDVVENTTW